MADRSACTVRTLNHNRWTQRTRYRRVRQEGVPTRNPL
jgi:hypothetical protein